MSKVVNEEKILAGNTAEYKKPTIKGSKVLEKEAFNTVFKFDAKGDSITGMITTIREQTTKFGVCNFIDLVEIETGELMSFVESSNLQGHNLSTHIGEWVKITFIDYDRNPKTKNMYKVFEVQILEVE